MLVRASDWGLPAGKGSGPGLESSERHGGRLGVHRCPQETGERAPDCVFPMFLLQEVETGVPLPLSEGSICVDKDLWAEQGAEPSHPVTFTLWVMTHP